MKTLIRQVKFLLTAALFCATSFAFGDNASNAPFVPTPAVSNLVKTLTWCSLGTSITDFNDNPIAGRTQGYQFFTMDKLGWSHDKLTNSGHSGACISAPQSKPPETPCDIYTIEFGVNDWSKGYPVGTLDDYKNYLHNGKAVRYNLFAACYRNLIEMIRKVNPNAVIVLMTPRKAYGSSEDEGTKMFPTSCDGLSLADQLGSYYDPVKVENVPGEQTHLKDYADLIKEIGEYEGFLVVDWYAEAATEENLASLSVDVAVHPNDAGYEIMADLLAPKILEAVSRIDFCKDCGEEEEVVNPKIVDIVALRNVAVATAVGSAPVLPATVKGLFANGAVSDGDYAVAWDNADAPSEEGVTEVSGTATVGDKSMTVTASVRAVATPPVELVNIAASGNMVVSAPGFSGDLGDTSGIINGISDDVPKGTWVNPPNEKWVNWNSRATTPDVNVNFTWDSAKKISKIFVSVYDGNQWPNQFTVKIGGQNIEGISGCVKSLSTANNFAYYKFNQSHGYLYTFSTPVDASDLSVFARMPSGAAGTNSYIGFNQIEIWAEDAQEVEIELLSTDTLSALNVDNALVAGFEPTTYSYEVKNGEVITSATSEDNMGITILPKANEAAYVVTLAEDGSSKKYTVSMPTVHVDVVALRNVAVATEVGVLPVLPDKVAGLGADGVVGGMYSVVWEEIDSPTVAGITTVEGTATVDGKSMSVTAFVRAETAPAGTLVNVSPGATPSTTGNKSNIDDLVSANAPDGLVWNTSNNRARTLTDILTWNESISVCKVRICYSAGHKLPATVTFKNEGDEPIQFAQGEKEVGSVHTWIEYTFNETVELNTLQCCFDMGEENQWLVVERIWAYELQAGGGIEPLTTDTLSMLEVDGVEVDGFVPTTYNYEVQGAEEITAATATDNMGITILPKYDGAAYAVTLAEDGKSTKTYVVLMPAKDACSHTSTTVTGEIAATCTTAGSTGTETCDECGKVIREAEEIPMLGHDWTAWEVTKYPTEEEAGSKHRECQREGCDAVEDEELPKLQHFVALRKVAGAVLVGKEYTLPTTVKGINEKGQFTDDIDVTWSNPTVVYDKEGVYTIEGFMTADSTKKVTATIRVEPVRTTYTNVSTEATPTTSDPNGGIPSLLISLDEPGNNTNWSSSNRNQGDIVNTLTWDSEVVISKVKVCYSAAGQHKAPTSYTFSTDLAESNPIQYTASEPETVGVNKWVEFAFDQPTPLTTLRCRFGGGGDWMIVYRIWAYEAKEDSEVELSSNAVLCDLKVDGKTVVDFKPEITSYTAYNGNGITSVATEDNASVTIIQKGDSDTAYVITLAEDGIATKTYAVAMPTVNIAALRNIALVTGVGMELSLPSSVMALDPNGGLIGKMAVEWNNAPTSYDKPGLYAVTGHAKADASLIVKASVRVEQLNITYKNNSPSAAVSSTDPQGKAADIARLILETQPAEESSDWVTSNRAVGDLVDTLTWEVEATIARVRVYYSANGSHKLPKSVEFSSDADGLNNIPYTAEEAQSFGVHKYIEYTFDQPVRLSTLRCHFVPPDDKQWIIVERIWAYKEVGGLDDVRSSNAEPTAITGNGVEVRNFEPNNTEKIYKISSRKNIALLSEDNIAMTILPEDSEHILRVVTLSEDGSSMRIYKLKCMGGLVFIVL